jgi:hypothetical protein
MRQKYTSEKTPIYTPFTGQFFPEEYNDCLYWILLRGHWFGNTDHWFISAQTTRKVKQGPAPVYSMSLRSPTTT